MRKQEQSIAQGYEKATGQQHEQTSKQTEEVPSM